MVKAIARWIWAKTDNLTKWGQIIALVVAGYWAYTRYLIPILGQELFDAPLNAQHWTTGESLPPDLDERLFERQRHGLAFEDYIQRPTRFLYSRYGSPNASSMTLSSHGMKSSSLIRKNKIGEMKAVSEPTQIDAPSKISSIPKYSGFRLTRNTPDVMSVEGFRCGFTVVLFFLKRESAQRLRTTPKVIGTTPTRESG